MAIQPRLFGERLLTSSSTKSGVVKNYPRQETSSAEEARDLHQHGWPRPRARQRFHRTPVALFEVRADLSRRLRHRPGTVSGVGKLLPLLQSPASAPGARLSDAGRSVPTQT